MAYDSHSDRIVLFGGFYQGTYFSDTWAYNLNANVWENKNPPDPKPAPRAMPGMAYDAESDRVVLFGGGNVGGNLRDTWAYDLNTNTWENKNSPDPKPAARGAQGMAYDSESDRVVLFGGFGDGPTDLRDTWAYNLNANVWENKNPPDPKPEARYQQNLVYDSESDRIVLFGGVGLAGPYFGDTWAYNLNANEWENKNPPDPKPGARSLYAASYALGPDRVILFGGTYFGNLYGDTWAYNLNANVWENKNPPDPKPSPRSHHAAASDFESRRLVLFGGLPTGSSGTDDTWAYDWGGCSGGGPNQLVLEKSQEWLVSSDTSGFAVHAADVDEDGNVEILTAGLRNGLYAQEAELRIWRWDGCGLALEGDRGWSVGGGVAMAVRAADTDRDGKVEIVTAGYTGTVSLDIRVWKWDGVNLAEEAALNRPTGNNGVRMYGLYLADADGDGNMEIFATGSLDLGSGHRTGLLDIWEWDGFQYAFRSENSWGDPIQATDGWSLWVGNIDGASPTEVLVGGRTTTTGEMRAQLRLLQWDGTNLVLLNSALWGQAGGNSFVQSVYGSDVEPDGVTEILTAGQYWDGVGERSQLRIWHGFDLFLEQTREWYDTGHSAANSLYVADVDEDAAIEILVSGESIVGAGPSSGQLTIFRWDGVMLTEEKRESWTTNGQSTRAFAIFALDVEPDTHVEILTAGRAFDPSLNMRTGQLRIWNWNLP